jgi:transcriptional regulator with XRE-family HTH domain
MKKGDSKVKNILIEIGNKIKKLRTDAGYSSYETFANDYDLDRKQYWRTENGSNITLSTLYRILKIHNLSFEEFFKGME